MAIDTNWIRETVDLIDLAGRYVTLRKVASNEYAGPCPKCGGTDRLHVKRDWFFCRQCYPPDMPGVGHDAIGWVRWLDGVDFREACDRLGNGQVATMPTSQRQEPVRPSDSGEAGEPSVKVYRWGDPDWQREAQRFIREAQARLELPEGQPGRDYLAGRGILRETWQRWGLGYATPRHPRLGEPRPAICLPWQGKGIVKAVQYRFFGDGIEHGDRFAQRPGGERTLYGVDLVGTHFDTLALVEGELNALSIWQVVREIGIDHLDVLSFGSESNAVSGIMADLARRYRWVIVWADDPDATRKAMTALTGAHGLRSVEKDGRKLDANALLQAGALGDFLRATLTRIETSEIGAILGDQTRPLTDRLAAGLAWLRGQEDAGQMGTPTYDLVFDLWAGVLKQYESMAA